MSRVKVNTINPFSGQNITLGGHAIPSSNDKNLGSEANAWAELYVSTGSVNFVAPITLGQPTVTVARLRAGGQGLTTGIALGQIFTETSGSLRGSFSVGRNNQASGTASLANGLYNTASGNYSHAEGYLTRAQNEYSHAEGAITLTLGSYSHAEGFRSTASGQYSHAEGDETLASGSYSHAEGQGSISIGIGSHAEGLLTTAIGDFSHTEGLFTIASGSYQTVVGKYNTNNNTSSLFVVGTGVGDGLLNPVTRKDGFSVELDIANVRPHIVLPTNTSNPNNPKTGSMYFNPSTNLMYIYNGTAWRSASFS